MRTGVEYEASGIIVLVVVLVLELSSDFHVVDRGAARNLKREPSEDENDDEAVTKQRLAQQSHRRG